MDKPFPLQLEEIFFPVQEVQANPEHDLTGNRAGTKILNAFNVQQIEGQPGVWGAELVIECDRESSVNPPYFFKVQAYAMVRADPSLDLAGAQAVATTTCFSVLVGAARERLMDLTSRAPWGRFMMGVVRLQTLPISADAGAAEN